MSFRAQVGYTIDIAGRLTLPLALGVLLGYYASDQGMRWLPTLAGLLCLLCVVALTAIVLGMWLQRGTHRTTPTGKKIRKRIIVLVALALLALTARLVVHWISEKSTLTSLAPSTFNRIFARDVDRYLSTVQELDALFGRLQKNYRASTTPRPLSPVEERLLRDAFAALNHASVVLEQLRMAYEDWYRFDPSRIERMRHTQAFILGYAAEIALYRYSIAFTKIVRKNPDAAKLLDTPHAESGMPADSLTRLEQALQGNVELTRVNAGRGYLRWLINGLRVESSLPSWGLARVDRRLRRHLAQIDRISPIERARQTVAADLRAISRSVRHVWFPAQSKVAEWMGDTKVHRKHHYLIGDKARADLVGVLRPGDVLLARKNWYLSNIGLPGFWPHAAIYVGDSNALSQYFDKDPQVVDFVRRVSGQERTFSQHLAALYPRHWANYRSGSHDKPFRVIEAISEGVSFSRLKDVTGDYLVALRPKLSKLAIAQAVLAAFSHLGKPYDFDFDFATDHALVCTELVWRSYRPAPDKPGLELPLRNIAGRRALPAHDIVKTFAERHRNGTAQFEFVRFYDAHEISHRAVRADLAAFISTAKRTKWDILLK